MQPDPADLNQKHLAVLEMGIDFEFRGKKFYAYHGTKRDKLEDAIKSNKYDYVLTVHTHLKRDERVGRTRIINPGALFRMHPYMIALLNVANGKLEFVKLYQRG